MPIDHELPAGWLRTGASSLRPLLHTSLTHLVLGVGSWSKAFHLASDPNTSTLGAPRSSVERVTGDAMAESRTSSPDEAAAEEREELLAIKLNLMSLHRSMVVGVELANVTREIAADHPGLGCSCPGDRHASTRRSTTGYGRVRTRNPRSRP